MEHSSALVQRVFGKVVCEQVPDQSPMNRSMGQALGTVLGVAVVGGAVLAGAVLTGAVLDGNSVEIGGWAELVHTNVRAAVPGGASALSQVALRCTRTVRKLLQLESLYSATEALTPHDNACTKYCMGPGARGSSMVGPAVQVFHVVASGFGAPEKLRERALHDVSSYAVMVTDTPI